MTSVERIQAIIASAQIDVLIATATDGSKLDHVHGSVQDLQAAVALMDESFEGPFYLEGYKAADAAKVGRKADHEKPFRWRMAGVAKASQNAPPAVRVETVKTVDAESIRKASEAHADARIAEHERKRAEDEAAELRAELYALRNEIDDPDDDDDDEGMDGAPLPWYADEEKTLRMMGAFRDLFAGITGKSAPTVPKSADVNDEERELLQAFRRFQAARPEAAATTKASLLEVFGNKQPAADEQ